jgi:hypothetical protein
MSGGATPTAGSYMLGSHERSSVNELTVTVRYRDGSTARETLGISRIVNCGRAWREPPAEEHHEGWTDHEQGPEPLVFPKPPHLLTTDREVWVNTRNTYGEAEFVLFPAEDVVYVGVGVDAKDRRAAEFDLHVGNSTVPSVVSDEVWVLNDVRDGWDDIELRSWTGSGGEWEPYQVASLSTFLEPEPFLDAVESKLGASLEGTAVWSSTVGTVDDDVQGPNPYPSVREEGFYAAQLFDPASNQRLVMQFDVRVNDWVPDVAP